METLNNNTNKGIWANIMIEETANFTFYKINLKCPTDSFFKLNVFEYDKLLKKNEGFLKKKFMSATSMLVKVENGSKAENQLKDMNRFCIRGVEAEVEIKEVSSLNSSQGTIFGPELNATKSADIIAVNDQIKGIERITKWDSLLMKRVNTDRYKVTFNTRTIPEKITIGFLKFGVRQYYPRPKGCLACLSYNHMLNGCPQKDGFVALCRKCGKDAGLDQEESKKQKKRVLKPHVCQNPPVCPNCPDGQNEHGSTSPECQARMKESEIIKMKIDHNLSYGEARKRVNDHLHNPNQFRGPAQTIREQVEALWRAKETELQLKLDIEDIKTVTENIRKLIEEKKQAILNLEREKEELKRITEEEKEEYNQQDGGSHNEDSFMDIGSVINDVRANNPVIDLTKQQPTMSKQTKAKTTLSPSTSTIPSRKSPKNKQLKYKELEILLDKTKAKELTQANLVQIMTSLTPQERQRIKNLRETSKRQQKTLFFMADDDFLYSQWK